MIGPANQVVYSTEVNSCPFEFILAVLTKLRVVQTHSDHPPSTSQTGMAWVHRAALPDRAPTLARPVSAQLVMGSLHHDGRGRCPQKCRVLLPHSARTMVVPYT